MPKRVIKATILGLERDGKPWFPKPGETVDLSAEEVKKIEEECGPGVLGLPVKKPDNTPTVGDKSKMAETVVTSDPVLGMSAGGGDPGDGDGPDGTLASTQTNPKPAVDSPGVRVKGSKPTKPQSDDDL